MLLRETEIIDKMEILLTKNFGDDSLQEFINQVNNGDTDSMTIYLGSDGGSALYMPAFRDIIERYQIHLVAFSHVSSSALDLFLLTNTTREILDDTVGMYHQEVYNHLPVSPNLDIKVEPSYLKIIKAGLVNNELVESFLNLSKKESKLIDEGVNLYINTKRLKRALKKSQKYFNKNLQS